MAASAEVAFLGNNAVTADANLFKAVKNDIIPNPTVVTNFYFPGIGEASSRSDDDAFANLCPEQPQERLAEAIERMGT